MNDGFTLEIADGFARLTLRHPPVNVLRIHMLEAMAQAVGELRDPSLKALVWSAEGSTFSAGMDVGEHFPEHVDRMLAAACGFFQALWQAPLPVVAVVAGAALGGAMEALLVCDAVLARDDARFALPEVSVGAFPPLAAVLLPRVLPWPLAFDLLAGGRALSAEEARAVGLVNAVYAPERFADEVAAWLDRFASRSAAVVRQARWAAKAARGDIFDGLEQAERRYREELLATRDALEGLRAFQEKRAPQWEDG